jgi:hypothetical protein
MSELLFYFALIIGVIPILLLKINKARLVKETFFIEPFLWLIIISGLYEFFGTQIMGLSAEVWFRLYLLLEFSTLFYFFWKLLKGNYRIFFIAFGVVFVLSFIVLLFFWYEWNRLKTDSYLSVLEIIFVYSSSIMWFKDIFTELQEKSLLGLPVFYFLSGFILYFSGTLFLFLICDQLTENNLNFEAYWNLNIIFNIILRLFLIVGIWKGHKQSIQYFG